MSFDPEIAPWVCCPRRVCMDRPCACPYGICSRARLAEHQDITEHATYTEGRTSVIRRGRCSCGWVAAQWRTGQTAGWEATADADEHYNDVT